MNILLDTHLAIWVLFDDINLSAKAKKIILNPENNIYYSVVSSWEVLLKHAGNPHNMLTDVHQFVDACRRSGFLSLKLSDRHIITVETLSLNENAPDHKDPFDKRRQKQKTFFFSHMIKNCPYITKLV